MKSQRLWDDDGVLDGQSFPFEEFKVFFVLCGSWLFLVLRKLLEGGILTFFPAEAALKKLPLNPDVFRGGLFRLFT